jgi:uncharacterized membrane protein HdeD (DUF308 family)
MHALARLPLALSFAIIVALSVLVPWLAVSAVRRIWPHPRLEANNELVGFTYGVFGLIYGVLLAYTIVVAWERFAETERLVNREATVLSELWRDSQAFPPDQRTSIHTELMSYTQSVVEVEWRAMAEHGEADPLTAQLYEQLWKSSYQLAPATRSQESFLQQYLERMNELSSTRRLRILDSSTEVHSVLWLVLLMGSIMTVGYTLLFSSKNIGVHVLITSCIMLMALLGLLVIVSLQYPFTGDVSVRPDAFRSLLDSFRLRMLPLRVLLR